MKWPTQGLTRFGFGWSSATPRHPDSPTPDDSGAVHGGGGRVSSCLPAAESFLGWLAEKAGDYLRWYDARRVRNEPVCPDCEQPESWCYCEQQAREQAMCESAFDIGYERAQEDAWRPY